jgi:glyoxylase-like metal-dependent hydrolase (beta-lactamase superfamily II)
MPEGQLEIIDLDIEQLGYLKFISSWLYHGPEGNFLIDPGPACTIPTLYKKLDEKGVTKLDWVLLTHIHQDHAGGLAHLMEKFPDAKVVTHEKGADHLTDPKKIWEDSKVILGEVAEIYGEILPVPKDNIMVLDEVPFGSGISVIPTPGHASHHQCFVFKDWFFAGELFGAHIPVDHGLYLRPATPHRFELEEYLNSMDLVEKYLKNTICFAHYGTTNNPSQILQAARKQLQLWVEIIDKTREAQDMYLIINSLLDNDEVFARFNNLDIYMRAREWNFAVNSISGILKYLETR